MTDEITIRRGTLDDVDTMTRLRRDMQTELWSTDSRPDAVSPDDIVELNRDYFREKLPTGEFVAFLAEVDGETVGTGGVVLYRAPPTSGNPTGIEGYVMNMYTAPGYRGRGIASRILDHLVQHARSIGARRVWLRASEFGRPVYERYGFDADPHSMAYRIPQGEGE